MLRFGITCRLNNHSMQLEISDTSSDSSSLESSSSESSSSESSSSESSVSVSNLRSSDSDNTSKTDSKMNEDQGKASDWRAGKNIRRLHLALLLQRRFTDVEFLVGPEKGRIKAHKCFLAAASPVFEAMFYGELAEKVDTISIPDISLSGFLGLMIYIYGGQPTVKSVMSAFQSWIAADKYCVQELKEHCEKYLLDIVIGPSDIWCLLENSVALGHEALMNKCKAYLSTHADACLRAEGFHDISVDTLLQVLRLESLNTTELILLKCVMSWGRHRDAPTLREALSPVLPLVRFGALSPADFCQFLEEAKDVLDESDALAILKHLTKPSAFCLPSWCFPITWERTGPSSLKRKADPMDNRGLPRRQKSAKRTQVRQGRV